MSLRAKEVNRLVAVADIIAGRERMTPGNARIVAIGVRLRRDEGEFGHAMDARARKVAHSGSHNASLSREPSGLAKRRK